MSGPDECGWCNGTGHVTLYRKGYEGNSAMIVEELQADGEIVSRRVPGTIAIHCRECRFGEDRYQKFKEEDRRKLWTTRHLMAERPNYLQRNYLTTDPTYTPRFETWAEGIDWFLSLGRPSASLQEAAK